MTEQEKQRTIGQEIILSRMIKCINEDAKINGLPLIGTGKITRWFGIEARKVQNMMDLCASLEKTKIAKEVAGRAQVHELYALRVIVDLGEGILKGMWKSSVDSITDACNGYYRLAYGEREIPDAAGFKEMIEQLRHIVVDRIGDVSRYPTTPVVKTSSPILFNGAPMRCPSNVIPFSSTKYAK